MAADIGPGSSVDCTSSGIEGYSGPQDLVMLGFEVTGVAGQGTMTIEDNPESTAPYSDTLTVTIPHGSPGLAADYIIQGPDTPTPVDTPTQTAPPTATATVPTSTETPIPVDTPSPDLNGDGIVDAADLLILLRQWHTETGQTR
jgi:hypothetical protein